MSNLNQAIEELERQLYSEDGLKRRHRATRRGHLLDDLIFIRRVIAEIGFIAGISLAVFALAFFLIFALAKV